MQRCLRNHTLECKLSKSISNDFKEDGSSTNEFLAPFRPWMVIKTNNQMILKLRRFSRSYMFTHVLEVSNMLSHTATTQLLQWLHLITLKAVSHFLFPLFLHAMYKSIQNFVPVFTLPFWNTTNFFKKFSNIAMSMSHMVLLSLKMIPTAFISPLNIFGYRIQFSTLLFKLCLLRASHDCGGSYFIAARLDEWRKLTPHSNNQ